MQNIPQLVTHIPLHHHSCHTPLLPQDQLLSHSLTPLSWAVLASFPPKSHSPKDCHWMVTTPQNMA